MIGEPAEAAFFDLDKTVIAKASMVAFGGPLYRAGLITRRLLLRALYGQLVYMYVGADEARMARTRDAVLTLTKGWERARVRAIVRETLEEVIEPIVYDEALDLIRLHRDSGRKVYLVSASPEEIVDPLADYLGVDGGIATRAGVDADGRYTGEMEWFNDGPHKAEAIVRVAADEGIDLSRSYAYSDSATDIPMLATVGHPVAVNPDRELLRKAESEGWEVQAFSRRVRLRDRMPMPPGGAATLGGGLAAVVAAVVVWWWLRRQPDPPPPPPPWWRTASRAAGAWLDLRRLRGPSWRRRQRARRGRRAGAASSWPASLGRTLRRRPWVGR